MTHNYVDLMEAALPGPVDRELAAGLMSGHRRGGTPTGTLPSKAVENG
jgi:hypothetical protein